MDSTDRDRIDEARHELHKIVNDREMRDVIILVFANKQDLNDGMFSCLVLYLLSLTIVLFLAMKPTEIQDKLGLTMNNFRQRNWYVQPACALSGDGLHEGLTWLMSNHK